MVKNSLFFGIHNKFLTTLAEKLQEYPMVLDASDEKEERREE